MPRNAVRSKPHIGEIRELVWGESQPSFEPRNLYSAAVSGGSYKDFLRGGASTRFHPKRRASTDHKPGPNIARAPATVPNRTEFNGSPARARICVIAIKAATVPAIGVHRPGMRRIPDAARNTEVMAVWIGGPLHPVELARTSSVEPATRRMRSKPMPGQPPANVEYKRRTDTPFCTFQIPTSGRLVETPKRVAIVTL